MNAMVFRRIELDQLEQAESEGWRPAVEVEGAVGVDSVSAGTVAALAVVREVTPRHADGSVCWLLAGACICAQLGRSAT